MLPNSSISTGGPAIWIMPLSAKSFSLFYEAQSACALGRFSEELAIYTTLPIGRLSPRLVR
jgi:hypothetical protein